MRAAFVTGRMLFGGFFAWSGLNHFLSAEQLRGYAASKGTPKPELAVLGSGALIVAGGLSVMTGIKPRRGLAAILAFLVPVSFQMHRFWAVEDPVQRQLELVNFMKNMALAGAALMMMQLPEPWPASLPVLQEREEMYVRLGGRDLQALPA